MGLLRLLWNKITGFFRRGDAADDNAADENANHTEDHGVDGSAPSYDGITDTDGQSEHPPPPPAKRFRKSLRLASPQQKASHKRHQEAQKSSAARKKAEKKSAEEAALATQVQTEGQRSTVDDDPDAATNVPADITDTQHPVQASTAHQQATQPDAQQTYQDAEQKDETTNIPTTTTEIQPGSTTSTLDPALGPLVQATEPHVQQTGQETEQGNASAIGPTTTTGMQPRSTGSTHDPVPSHKVHQQAILATTQQARQAVATGSTAHQAPGGQAVDTEDTSHQAPAGQLPPTSASTPQHASGPPSIPNTIGVQPAFTLNPAAPAFAPAGPVQAAPGSTQQASSLPRGRGNSRLGNWVVSHRGRATSRFFGGS